MSLNNKPDLNRKALLTFLFAVAISAIISWLLQPLVHGNDTAITTIVTVFSILSGFSILVISQLGDVSLVPHGDWKIVEINKSELKKKLTAHKVLFLTYLSTLLAALFLSLIRNDSVDSPIDWAQVPVEYLFLFLSSISMIASYKLPYFIEEIQEYRYDIIIKERKKRERESLKENK
ncbi:MAG: hypothetical protein WD604_06755 [Balneolaceae bacterium]